MSELIVAGFQGTHRAAEVLDQAGDEELRALDVPRGYPDEHRL